MNRTWATPDFGERLRAEILARHKGVIAFCLAKGFAPQDVYRWIKGQSPTYEAMMRLSIALEILPAKLQWGEDLGEKAVERYSLAKAFPAKKLGDADGQRGGIMTSAAGARRPLAKVSRVVQSPALARAV